MKKIIAAMIAALATVAVVSSSSSAPAGAGDVPRAAGPGVAVPGEPVAGSTLTVEPAAWSTKPDSRRYEWLRDGEDAVLSRQPSYTVTPADIGHTLVVVERIAVGSTLGETSFQTAVVTATSGAAVAGSPPAAAPVPAPAAAAPTPAVNIARPTITGRPSVGKRLSVASKGRWSAPGHRFGYQWLRNGKAISGATKTTYRLTTKDRTQRISLRVQATRAGYPTVRATSAKTSRIR
jgi:hypothetical protein